MIRIPEMRLTNILPQSLRYDFMVQMDKKSIDRIQILAWLGTVLYICLFVLDYLRIKNGTFQESIMQQLLFFTHVGGLLFIVPALLITLHKEKIKATRLSRGIIIWLMFVLMAVFLLFQSILSYMEYSSLTLFMTYVLAANWAFTMNYAQRIALNLICIILMCTWISIISIDDRVLFTIRVYEATFFPAIAFILGLFDYNTRMAKFLKEQRLSLRTAELDAEKKKTESLLLNILPASVAQELRLYGKVAPKRFEHSTVMFTDFQNFTRISSEMDPAALVEELNIYFDRFDHITSQFGLEKIKTIGDSYMCAGGIPEPDDTHVQRTVMAALAMRQYMLRIKEEKDRAGLAHFSIRIGIHTGPIVAGIVGSKKFAYDVWGDTVNIASRMELHCEPWKINITEATLSCLKHVIYTHRGKIEVKNKGPVDMYYVDAIGIAANVPRSHFKTVKR